MSDAKVLDCPECGGGNPLHNPGIMTLRCRSCAAVIIRGQDGAKAGEQAQLLGSFSGMYVGGKIVLNEQRLTVIGRLQFQHESGRWDEWYCETRSGDACWLVEDARSFLIEEELSEYPEGLSELEFGQSITVSGLSFQVTEMGEATLRGVDGQLPRGGEPGETIRYIDLTEINGQTRLSAEIDEDGARAYLGQQITKSELSVRSPRFEKAPWEDNESGATIPCMDCGSAMILAKTKTPLQNISCRDCGSNYEREGDQANLTGKSEPRHDFELEIGAKGVLRGEELEVIGRCVYRAKDREDGCVYTSYEYTLRNAEGELRALEIAEEGSHFIEKSEEIPAFNRIQYCTFGDAVFLSGKKFRLYESGTSELVYVDGCLPYTARVGETTDYRDFLHIPQLFSFQHPSRLSVEWTFASELKTRELEASRATAILPKEMVAAFPEADFTMLPRGILAPSRLPDQLRMFAAGWLAVAVFGLVTGAGFINGKKTLLTQITANAANGQIETISDPFRLEGEGELLEFTVSSGVNQGWIYSEIDLIDANSQASFGYIRASHEMYSGVEGGESWSEGKTRSDRILKSPGPGKFRLKLTSLERSSPARVMAKLERVERDPRWYWWVAWSIAFIGLILTLCAGVGRKFPFTELDSGDD